MPHAVGHGVNPDVTPLQRALTAARGIEPPNSSILGPVTNQDRQQALLEIAERDRRRRRDRSRSVGEFAGDTALSLLGGAVGLGQAAFGIGNIATGGFLDEATGGFSENFRRTQQFLDESQSEPLRLRREGAFRAFEEEGVGAGIGEFLKNPSLIVDTATEALPSLIPAIGAGQLAARTAGAVGGRVAAEKAAKRAVLRTVGAQTAGATNVEAVNTLRDQGVGQAGRQLGGLGGAALAGVLAPGISRVTGAAGLEARAGSRLAGLATGTGTAGAVARGAGAGAVREGLEEGAQGAAEQFSVNLVAPNNDFFTETGRAAAMGVIAGTPLGTVLGAAGATGTQDTQPAGTREAEEQEAQEGQRQAREQRTAEQRQEEVTRVRQAGEQVLSDIQKLSEAQAQGRDLSEVTGLQEVSTDSFLQAQEVVVRQLFNVGQDTEGNEVFTTVDPETGQEVTLSREDALQAANEFMLEEAQTFVETGQLPLDLSSGTAITPNAVPAVDEATGQQDLFARQPATPGLGVQPQSPAPEDQLDLPLPPGTEPAPGSVPPVDIETGQLDLFANQPPLFRERLATLPEEQATREVEAVEEARAENRKQAERPLEERWRSAFSEQLGLKKQKIKGKTFQEIMARARERNVAPDDEGSTDFLREEALNLVPDEAKATDFEIQFSEAFTPQSREELPGAQEAALPDINDSFLVDLRNTIGSGRIDRLTKSALQEMAARAGVKVTGRKDQLKQRLREHLDITVEAIRTRQRDRGAEQIARDVREGRREVPRPVTSEDRARERARQDALQDIEAEETPTTPDETTQVTELAAEQDTQETTTATTNLEDIISPARVEREDTTPLTDTEVQQLVRLDTPNANRRSVIEVRGNTPRLVEQSVNTGKNLKVLLRGDEGQTLRAFQQQVAEFNLERVRQGEELVIPGTSTPAEEVTPATQQVAPRFIPVSEAELTDRAQEAIDPLLTEDAVPILSNEELVGLQENLFEEISAEVRSRNLNRRQTAAEEVFVSTMNDAPSLGALEANFQAILQMDDYVNGLSKRAQDVVVQAYSDAYDKLAPNRFLRTDPQGGGFVDYRTRAQRQEDEEAGVEQFEGPIPPRNRRTPERRTVEEQTPLQPDRVQPIIEAVTEGDRGGVTVYNTVKEYRNTTGQAAPPDAAGVYNADGVSVILENINTEEKLAEVLAHERGHRGLDQLLGDRLPAVTNRLWANSAIRGRIREKMRVEELDRARAAEEVLVDMLVHGERLNADVASKIRSGVESFFQTALGVGKYRVPDRQINRLLQDTGAYLRVGNADSVIGQSPLTTEDVIPLDEMLGSPEFITGTPRFSRVYERLAQTVPQANPEGTNVNDFSVAAKEAVEASSFRLRDMWTNIKSGKTGRDLGGFLPLSQTFNLHSKKFERTIELEEGTTTTDNPLRDIRDLTDRQEARFNKRVTQKRKLTLDNETFEVSTHDIADAADRLQRRNPEAAKSLNQVLQFSTFYQTWPQKSFEEQSQVDYSAVNFTEEERRQAYAKLKQLYDGMGDEARVLYRQMQASYRDMWQAHLSALETELRRVNAGELPEQSLTLQLAQRRLDSGPYSPLVRHGNYTVTVRGKESGDVVYSSAHDTQTEARHTQAMVGQEYSEEDGFTVSVSQVRQGDFRRDHLTQAQIRDIENIISEEIPDDTPENVRVALRNALIDTYMRSVPEGSFKNFSQRRQNIDGFSMDGIRAYSDYSIKASRIISGIETDGELANAFGRLEEGIKDKERSGQDTIIERQVQRRVEEQYEARIRRDFNRYARALSGAGFMYMLTSPSQMVVNASQTAMVTFPRLAAKYGADITRRVGSQALSNYFKAGRDFLNEGAVDSGAISVANRQVMQALFEEGTLDFTLTNDIADIGNGASGELNSSWRKTMEFMSSFIHKSEVFNRQIAAYMTTAMEMERRGIDGNQELPPQLLEELKGLAKDKVYETQFNYSKGNKAPVMQGPIRGLVFQFQQFRLNMLAMYAKDLRDAAGWGDATPEEKALARRSLAYMTGAQLAFTGTTGTVLSPIVFGIMDAFADDDEDFIDSRTAFVEGAPSWLSHGLVGGVLNVDPGRFSLSDIIPLIGDLEYAPTTDDPTQTASYLLERNIGPWWGLVTNAIGGVSKAMGGEFSEAGTQLLPKPLADPIKAIMETEGVRNNNGTLIHEPGVWGGVLRSLGFRDMERVEAQNTVGAAYEANKRISLQRRKRLTRLAVAFATGNLEDRQEAMEDIQEWNRTNPQFAIKGQDIGRLRTRQGREQANVDRFGIPLSQQLTPAFRRAAGQEQ